MVAEKEDEQEVMEGHALQTPMFWGKAFPGMQGFSSTRYFHMVVGPLLRTKISMSDHLGAKGTAHFV